MSSHYKFYDGMGEVVPFSARYSYPTQANRSWKSHIKIGPKNGATFSSAQSSAPIRIEFPAQGYLNSRNSFLTFDATFNIPTGSPITKARFQNNIQSVFRRVRLVYGSLPIEDIPDYNILVRLLTETTGTNSNAGLDQTSIAEGVGGITTVAAGPINARLQSIQAGGGWPGNTTGRSIWSNVNDPTPRRYQVQLALGFLQQNKLLPLKFMASQLSLELELAPWTDCVCHNGNVDATAYYTLSNIAFNAELLEFDSSYDAAMIEALNGQGIPIKFASWNKYDSNSGGASNVTIQIPERNRSLKAIFNVQVPPSLSTCQKSTANPNTLATMTAMLANSDTYLGVDSHAFLQSSNGMTTTVPFGLGWLKSWQLRIGGKYYPAQPVDNGSVNANGGAESYNELAKALNIVGDYRLSTAVNTTRWTHYWSDTKTVWSGAMDFNEANTTDPRDSAPSCFIVAADLETSSGAEVSGLNGEEQNDIALMLNYSAPQSTVAQYKTFVYYDALLVLRENNAVELIK